MTDTPETHPSLLVRVKDPTDRQAWSQFVEVYRPVIHRLARRKGLQHADAEDLVQRVLVAVAGSIDRWEHDAGRARFRTWLHRVAHNLIINCLAREIRPDRGSGDTGVGRILEQQGAIHDPDSRLLALEYRREVFRWAAEQIRDEFHPDTWQAFWRTAVQGQPAQEVARELDKQLGSVYAARSRIMRRLRQTVQQFEASDPPDD